MKNEPSKTLSLLLFAGLLIFSVALTFLRMGYLPWLGVMLGVVGLLMTFRLSGKKSMQSFLSFALLFGVAWLGSSYYVYYQWESGEVVDIAMSPEVTVRTWVMDDEMEQGSQQIVIYEAPPEHQPLLENIHTVTVTRDDEPHVATINAILAEELSTAEYERIFALYLEKYETLSFATDIYYLTIGPKRGSKLYILYLLQDDHEQVIELGSL